MSETTTTPLPLRPRSASEIVDAAFQLYRRDPFTYLLIAAVCYAASWEIYYPSIGDEFMQKYTAQYVDKLRASGASAEEVEKTEKDMAKFGEMYKNPLVRFPMSMLEILPVGIIVTLISAGLLRRREVLSAQPA